MAGGNSNYWEGEVAKRLNFVARDDIVKLRAILVHVISLGCCCLRTFAFLNEQNVTPACRLISVVG